VSLPRASYDVTRASLCANGPVLVATDLSPCDEELPLGESGLSLNDMGRALAPSDSRMKPRAWFVDGKDEALTPSGAPRSARDEALPSTGASLNARDEALTPRDASLSAKDEPLTLRDASLGARGAPVGDKAGAIERERRALEAQRRILPRARSSSATSSRCTASRWPRSACFSHPRQTRRSHRRGRHPLPSGEDRG
jgi:hypothetical protein